MNLPSPIPILLFSGLLMLPSAWAGETEWTGSIDNDWTNPDNWSNGVPDADTDVLIPHQTPVALIDGDEATARDIVGPGTFQIQEGGRLEARNLTTTVDLDSPIFSQVMVRDAGSELIIEEDFSLARAISRPSEALQSMQIRDGARLEVGGDMIIAENIGNGAASTHMTTELRDEGSEMHVGNLILDRGSDFTWLYLNQSARLIVENDFILGPNGPSGGDPGDSLEIVIGSSMQGGASGLPPPILDLRASDPAIHGPGTGAGVVLNTDEEDYSLVTEDGTPIDLTGTVDLVKWRDTNAIIESDQVTDGHITLEEGSLILPGEWPDASVHQDANTMLRASAAIGQLDAAGNLRVGTESEPGPLQITENLIRRASSLHELRIHPDGQHDALHAGGTIEFDGGVTEVQIADGDYPDEAEFVIMSTGESFIGEPNLVFENDSDRLVEYQVLVEEIRVTLIAQPQMDISTTQLDFGEVEIGDQADATLILSNAGQAPLIVQPLPEPALPFARTGGDCPAGFAFVLSEDQTCQVVYTFMPLTPENHEQALIIQHNAADEETQFTLSGTGTGEPVSEIFEDRFEP